MFGLSRLSGKRLSALGLAMAFILTSCGGSDSSSEGRTKNSALCFATQEDKDAAIATAQADLDAANATATSGDTTVPSETTTPPSDTTVVDSGPNLAMLEQALTDAQNQALCDVVNASSDSESAPYFNAPLDLTAVGNDDGTVDLSWTAPEASNVEPFMYNITFYKIVDGQQSGGWGVWTYAPNTTYQLGSWFWDTIGGDAARIEIFAGTSPCVGEGEGDCLYGPVVNADVYAPGATPAETATTDTTPADVTPPYFNALTNLTATANTDGSVALNWTAPEASNIDPYLIVVSFYDIDSGQEVGGWGVWTRGTNTSFDLGHWMFDGNNPVTTGYGPVRFKLYAGSAACVGVGSGECLYGPSTSVDVNVLDPNGEATGATETTVASDTTATTIPSDNQLVIIETPLSVVELLTETTVLVPNDVATMVCDESCISAMFSAANLDAGTVTINGVSAAFGSKSLRFPVDGKNGAISAVVTSTDGVSALDVSTKFDHVVRKTPVAGSAVASTSTTGSSKMKYIYVLVALLILIAVGYKRRKKEAETK